MVTMTTNLQLSCTYFININSDIITVIVEKRKRISACDPHFIDDSPTLHTQCTPLSSITSSSNQCRQHYIGEFQIRSKHTVNVRTINASSIQKNLLYKFGKVNLTSLNLKRPSTSTEHTTIGATPIQSASTSQHIHSGRYTIQKSILISHISDDSDEEININQTNIDTCNMWLLLLHLK